MYRGKTRSPLAVVLLTFITLGVYGLVWMYKFSKEVIIYTEDPKASPGLDLFLSIIIFPYIIYWFYKYGKMVDRAQEKAGQPPREMSVVYAILTPFGLFIINMALMQLDMNAIWEKDMSGQLTFS